MFSQCPHSGFGSSDNPVWLTLKRKVLHFIPVFDNSKRKDSTWSRADFSWDEDKDLYICPEGREVRHTRRHYSDPARNTHGLKARNYGALKSDCQVCPSKAKCCPSTDTHRIRREKYEIVRDVARQCTASEYNSTAQKRRKKVEMLFTHLKRILGLGRLRLRAHAASKTNLSLPPPPKTSANWQNSSQWCPPPAKSRTRHRSFNKISELARSATSKPTPFSTKSAQFERCCAVGESRIFGKTL